MRGFEGKRDAYKVHFLIHCIKVLYTMLYDDKTWKNIIWQCRSSEVLKFVISYVYQIEIRESDSVISRNARRHYTNIV